MTVSLYALNTCSDSEFVGSLGAIFEHSPWVAKAVVGNRPFASVDNLHAAMVAAIAVPIALLAKPKPKQTA